MADEFRAQVSLQLNKGNSRFQSQLTAFTADQEGVVGPTPGTVLISKYGTNVDLSQIILPGGFCMMTLLTDGVYVEWGAYDVNGSVGDFIPVGELQPGEPTMFRLSRQIGEELGTGSGTAFTDTGVRLRLKAVGGPAQVKVEAFDA